MSETKYKRDKKKQLGQFMTPESLSWSILKHRQYKITDKILEPSFGKGSFLFGIIRQSASKDTMIIYNYLTKDKVKLYINVLTQIMNNFSSIVKSDNNTEYKNTIYLNKYHYLNIEKIITHRFNLENVNEAFDVLRSGDAGRIIIEM
jgi:hypothetical protein